MDPASLVNQNTPNGVAITDEMVDGVRLYINEVTQALTGAGCGLSIERRVAIAPVHPDAFGTLDASAVDYPHAMVHIFDFKYGFMPVEIFENWQLIMYAIGVLASCDFAQFPTIPNVKMTVVQPRAYHRDGPVRSWILPLTEMRGYTKRLTVAAAEALGPNPQCRTGLHCVWCDARHACRALGAAVGDALQYATEALPDEMDPAALAVELSIVANARDLLEFRFKALETQAIAMMQGGKALTGWQMEQGMGKAKFTCNPETLDTVGRMAGKDLFKRAPITPNQAIAAGLDAAVVAKLSGRDKTGWKVKPDSSVLARKVFSK